MPLDPQNVPISLAQGVDTKTDQKQLVIGKLSVLQNASFSSPKQIQKRPGFGALTKNILGGGTVSKGVGVASFKDELISLDGSSLYSYSPDLTKQVNRGLLVPTSLSVSPVVRNTNLQTQPDSALDPVTGLQCFVWNDFGSQGPFNSINYSIFDSTTGAAIVNDQVVSSSGVAAKVLTLGTNFIIIYYDLTGTALKYKAISTATPTVLGAAVTIASDISSAVPAFDATIINGSAYIAYRIGTTQIGFYSISSTLVRSSQFIETTSFAAVVISIKGDASFNVWCSFGTTGFPGNIYAFVVNSALNSTVLATTLIDNLNVSNITMLISGSTASIYYQGINNTTSAYVKLNTITITGTVGTPVFVMRGVGLASKAFVYGGVNYFLVVYAGAYVPNSVSSSVLTTIEPTYFLINGSGKIIAKLAPSTAGLFYDNPLIPSLLPEVIPVSSTIFSFPYLLQDDLSSVNGNVFYNTGIQNAKIDFQIPYAMPKLVAGNNLLFASGQMWQYDGASVVEQGFHIYPENITSQITYGGGGIGSSLNNHAGGINQVQYIALYEWVDNQGQLNRSATSPALTVPIPDVTSGSPGITPITFTANSTVNSPVLTSISSFTGLNVGQVVKDTSNPGNFPAGTYIVQIGSTTLTLSEVATGTVVGDTFSTSDVCLISITVPTLRQTLKKNVSIVLYRTENNQTIFYRVTSPLATTSGLAENQFVFNDPTSDTITIVDSLPDSQIVGNEQLYTTGGEVSNFAPPALSAVTTFKNRIVYLSPENPYQYGYSKQIIDGTPAEFSSLLFFENVDQRIGKITAAGPLDDKLILFGPHSKFYVVGDGPSPSGANNDFSEATKIAGTTGCENPDSVLELPVGLIYQDTQKGIWLLDRSLSEQYIGADVEAFNSQTVTSAKLIPGANQARLTLNSGVALVYDYYLNQWETDVYPAEAIDSAIFENGFVYIQADGQLYQQTPSLYLDDAAFIPMSLTTGWMNFGGIEGFQRVWELQIFGTYKSPHTLNVSIFTDYSSVAAQTVTIPVLTQPNLYQYRITMKVQKCETIRVQIAETQQAPYGEGLSLSGLAFRVGIKKGLDKLPAGASY